MAVSELIRVWLEVDTLKKEKGFITIDLLNAMQVQKQVKDLEIQVLKNELAKAKEDIARLLK